MHWLKVLVSVNLLPRLAKPRCVLVHAMDAWRRHFGKGLCEYPTSKEGVDWQHLLNPLTAVQSSRRSGPYIVTSLSALRELGWRRCWRIQAGRVGLVESGNGINPPESWAPIIYPQWAASQSCALIERQWILSTRFQYLLVASGDSMGAWKGFNSGQGPWDDHSSARKKQKFRVQIACVGRIE